MKGFTALFSRVRKEKKANQRESVIQFWDEQEDPPYQIVLTSIQDETRCFRHAAEEKTSLLVGFSSEMDMRVNYDKSVSRQHCELIREGDLFSLVNHSQSNGTYLNQTLVLEKTPIFPGDIITMGRVELRFNIE